MPNLRVKIVSGSLATITAFAMLAAGCVPPPNPNPANPYRCSPGQTVEFGEGGGPRLNDDGSVVVYHRQGAEQVVVDRDGGTSTTLFTEPPPGARSNVVVAGDGSTVIGHLTLPVGEDSYRSSDWVRWDASTGTVRALDNLGDEDVARAISEDGSKLVIGTDSSVGGSWHFSSPAIVDLTSGHRQPIDLGGYHVGQFSSDLSVFAAADPNVGQPVLVDPLTGAASPVGGEFSPTLLWGLWAGVDFVGDDTLLVTGMSPTGAPSGSTFNNSAWLVPLDGSAPVRVDTGVPNSWVSSVSTDGERLAYMATDGSDVVFAHIGPSGITELVRDSEPGGFAVDREVTVAAYDTAAGVEMRCF